MSFPETAAVAENDVKAEEGKGGNDGKKPETPYENFAARVKEFLERLNAEHGGDYIAAGNAGVEFVRYGWVSDQESEDEDEEKDIDPAKITEEEVAATRLIVITRNRNEEFDTMRDFILGDQTDAELMCFDTSFSYSILNGFRLFQHKLYPMKKSWAAKFDLLLAYTYNLMMFNVWAMDNEGGMENIVEPLAAMWKTLLAKDDNELGIDSEYTRAGTITLLEDFREMLEELEECYNDPPLEFEFE